MVNTKTNRLLWLDDIRDPNDTTWQNWLIENHATPSDFKITWVKNADDFVNYITNLYTQIYSIIEVIQILWKFETCLRLDKDEIDNTDKYRKYDKKEFIPYRKVLKTIHYNTLLFLIC